jgi:hypothetical protein
MAANILLYLAGSKYNRAALDASLRLHLLVEAPLASMAAGGGVSVGLGTTLASTVGLQALRISAPRRP